MLSWLSFRLLRAAGQLQVLIFKGLGSVGGSRQRPWRSPTGVFPPARALFMFPREGPDGGVRCCASEANASCCAWTEGRGSNIQSHRRIFVLALNCRRDGFRCDGDLPSLRQTAEPFASRSRSWPGVHHFGARASRYSTLHSASHRDPRSELTDQGLTIASQETARNEDHGGFLLFVPISIHVVRAGAEFLVVTAVR